MGLFVVSRLALRHGLTVQLDHNDRMGITATVFLPTSVLSDTARLEAGSGGAQVIELGAATVQADDGVRREDDAEAEYAEHGVDADVVDIRPEPEPEEDFDPITAAINAYGLPQRRPGASGAGSRAPRCRWAAASSTGSSRTRRCPSCRLPRSPRATMSSTPS